MVDANIIMTHRYTRTEVIHKQYIETLITKYISNGGEVSELTATIIYCPLPRDRCPLYQPKALDLQNFRDL